MNNYDLFQQRLNSSTTISKDRLVAEKINSFKRALNSAYNSETIAFDDSTSPQFKALISTTGVDPKYERMSFSTLLENNCDIGTMIYWVDEKSFWLITRRTDTEHAIFQGLIDKANYELRWKDLDTGKIYNARAAITGGPEMRAILEYSKKDIAYDKPTEGLVLVLSKNQTGVSLLKRYSEIFVGERKWQIQTIDDYTYEKLVSVYLQEMPVNRELDNVNEKIVNGNIPIEFTVKTAIDGLVEIQQYSGISLNPMLFRNENLVPDADFVITTTNCSFDNGVVTFNNLGKAIVGITYPLIDKKFLINTMIVDTLTTNVNNINIYGSDTVRTMTREFYKIDSLLNGVLQPLNGYWTIDSTYAEILSQTSNDLTLKLKNKVGTFAITYKSSSDIVLIEKMITVLPIFERS